MEFRHWNRSIRITGIRLSKPKSCCWPRGQKSSTLHGGAYYNFARDTIRLPSPEPFARPSAYYATALHELGHWTAHPDRLDRPGAEIASLIVGSELGIGYDSERHAGYVDHWVQILTDTPKEILYVASDAERISDYILTIEQKQEIRHTQEVKDIPHLTEATT